jgi:hypothetical protein
MGEPANNAPKSTPSREQAFWQWVDESVTGWVRYQPEIAEALDSREAALVLSRAIHLSSIRSSSMWAAGGWFYKSIREWCAELYLGRAECETALDMLCVPVVYRSIAYTSDRAGRGQVRTSRTRNGIGLMQSVVVNRRRDMASPCTHYRVDFVRLKAWWQAQGFGQARITFPDDAGQLAPPVAAIRIDDEAGLSEFLLTPISISLFSASRLHGNQQVDMPKNRKSTSRKSGSRFPENQHSSTQETVQENHAEKPAGDGDHIPHTHAAGGEVGVESMTRAISQSLQAAGIWKNTADDLARRAIRAGLQRSHIDGVIDEVADDAVARDRAREQGATVAPIHNIGAVTRSAITNLITQHEQAMAEMPKETQQP